MENEKIETETLKMSQEDIEKSNLYMLDEMIDAMEKSIENGNEVTRQQEILLNIIKNSGEKSLDNFLESMEKTNIQEKENVSKLTDRLNLLKEVCEECHNSKEIEDVISKFCDAIGMFNR